MLLGAVAHNTSLCLHQLQAESKALLSQATLFHDIVCTVREAYWCVLLLLNSPHTLACLGLGVKTLNPNPAMDPLPGSSGCMCAGASEWETAGCKC